jgi:hypothetical protein
MALQKLSFRPGLNRDTTNYKNEGGWYECDKVRFISGSPEKLGGWEKYSPYALIGICRSMFGWVTSFVDNLLALGTNQKVYIEVGEQLNDITPLRATTTAGGVTFAASTGSSTLTVSDTAHGAIPGDFVTFSGAVSLGGNITAAVLNQNYEILTTPNADSYTITAKDPTTGAAVVANASDSGDGGASVVGAYEVTSGFGVITYGYGWGTSTWGREGWGTGSLQPINFPLTTWFFDNFDNDLVMNQNTGGKGAPFIWERGGTVNPTTALGTRGVLLSSLAGASDVPTEVGQILVSQTDKHLLAFGATPYGGGTFDPLLIRWASQDDPIDWTPELTNSAGFLRVSSGSRIVRAFRTRQETLVFTDATLNSLQFLGTTDVFGIQELETNISIAGPRAVTSANNVVYWMGVDKFYVYNGRVDTLPSTLRNHIFNNINFEALAYVTAGTNETFNEVWWFYPTANSNINDAYVVYNYREQIWYYGTINRSAWLDSIFRPHPQAIGGQYIYNHEVGTDDDGAAMDSYIQSSDFDIQDGEQFMLIRRMIPDVDFTGSTAEEPTVKLQIRPRNFPGSNYQTEAPENVIETSVGVYTDQVFMRARARQMGFKIYSDELGVAWQLGDTRLDARPDGRR